MGRHGGINILHEKSWHVWRMDNRLKVEKDKLHHAADEAERQQAQSQDAFNMKLAKLRRRANGDAEADGESRPFALQSTASGGSSSSHRKANLPKKEEGNTYKHGAVTLSNLKQAELYLDESLGNSTSLLGEGKSHGKGKRSSKGKGKVETTDVGLGSGPHINLFEEAEAQQQQVVAEHEKLLGYQSTNNDLLGPMQARKAMFSDFDEVQSVVPWYMRTRRPIEDGLPEAKPNATLESLPELEVSSPETAMARLREASKSRSRSSSVRITQVRKRKHGQVMVESKVERKKSSAVKAEDIVKAEVTSCEVRESFQSADEEVVGSAPVLKGLKLKKEKKKDKKEKKDRKDKTSTREKTGQNKALELAELRRQRQEREQHERTRTSRLVRCFVGA